MAKRKSLDEWIAEAFSDPHKDLPCTQLSLVVLVGNALEKEIHTVRLGPGNALQPKDLADMFIGKAQTFGQDLPGQQQFILQAFYKDRKEPEAIHPFKTNIPSDPATHGILSEPPNEMGLRAQDMRFKNDWLGTVFKQVNELNAYALRREDRDETRAREDRQYIRELQAENRECFAIVKDMMMRMADKTQEHEMARLKYARETGERKKWIGFVPALVNQLLGREIFPQSLEDTVLIEQVAESIPEEQIQMLSNILPPQLWGPLSARLEKAMAKKREENEAIAKLPMGNVGVETGSKVAE